VAEAKILHNIFVENSIENHPLGDSSRGNGANVRVIIYKN
jgi:hypothetical protein